MHETPSSGQHLTELGQIKNEEGLVKLIWPFLCLDIEIIIEKRKGEAFPFFY